MSLSEAEAIESELSPPFTVALPEQLKVPLVFNSPHSGRIYPSTFLAASRLDSLALRRSEDAYVEELFAFVTGLGAPLLYAHFPRAYLDVNREPYALDPVLFRDGLPHYANTQSVRVGKNEAAVEYGGGRSLEDRLEATAGLDQGLS